MRKCWIIFIVGTILLLIGIMAGIYVYEKNSTQDGNIIINEQLAIKMEQESEINQGNIISTSVVQEKISPNCILIEKIYYNGCDHLIKEVKEIPEQWINYSKEKIEEQYKGWDIEQFSKNEIVVYQVRDGICDKHYLIKEHDGVLRIYTIDENGTEIFKEDTNIQIMYLPEEDLERVTKGIEAIGDTQLHTVLEDFE